MTIILWLMVTPGVWEGRTETCKTHAKCHIAEDVLRHASPPKNMPEILAIREIYDNGGGIGMFWIGCREAV